jgi:hypothetical protein
LFPGLIICGLKGPAERHATGRTGQYIYIIFIYISNIHRGVPDDEPDLKGIIYNFFLQG